MKIRGVEAKVIGHKYVLEIKHPNIDKPFKMVVCQSRMQNTGEPLGWVALPEIQLRQTTHNKQEYIISNSNPTPESAIEECLAKMAITMEKGKDYFYRSDFDQEENQLW